ncbi:heat shock 70 kDa protein 12B-like isoform X1 [Mytilus galloprovincialis]|uniref:heat shock 70 kDa protein 12B-like isoform X1 n=1 Tax=Mytilus galloprovincialis TaxID=29158 RepID=UPI003F7B8DD1
MERGTSSKENVLVVVAIDFGTTYSGWAYSFRKEYKDNHTNIKTKGGWKNFDGQATEKTPTVALFTPEDKFHSFGYEAENKYAELVDEEQSTGWKYFKRFKMALLSDDTKQFGHQQRKLAGIDDTLLSLAYEPEAAAIYCRDIIIQKKTDGEDYSMASLDPGEKFLVLDCGGGTVDITGYTIEEGNKLIELFPPTGGPWGGTEVDKQFQDLIVEIFGKEVWHMFEKSCMHDSLELMRRFEGRKKVFGENDEDKVRIQCPGELFEQYKSKTGLDFQSELGVKKVRDKLVFPTQIMKDLFQKPLNAIIDSVRKLLTKPETKGLKTILMVGGFSESALLYEGIRSIFPTLNVFRPHEAVLSVVKGAVIFGHTPEIITERVCARTYGIAGNIPFDSQIHPQRCLGYYEGKAKCTDSFQTIVKKGDMLSLEHNFFERTFLLLMVLTKRHQLIYMFPEIIILFIHLMMASNV